MTANATCYLCGKQPLDKVEDGRCERRKGCYARATARLSRPLLSHRVFTKRATGYDTGADW